MIVSSIETLSILQGDTCKTKRCKQQGEALARSNATEEHAQSKFREQHDRDTASNVTGGGANIQQSNKEQVICVKNETQWFCSWEVVLALAGILIRERLCWWNGCLPWFVSLGRKNMSHVEVLVPK
jgi:hypothetical protein